MPFRYRLSGGRWRVGIGAAILQALGMGAGAGTTPDLGSIIGSIASGGVGGGLLMTIVSWVKSAMARRA